MTTPRLHTLVSLVATTTVALTLSACATAPSSSALDQPSPASVAIQFENESLERLHVYLVGARREWLLGRVEPGAITVLRLPEASLGVNEGSVRLAAVAGARGTLRAALDPYASLTIVQPVSAILSHQWRFAHGQLNPELRGPRRRVSRK